MSPHSSEVPIHYCTHLGYIGIFLHPVDLTHFLLGPGWSGVQLLVEISSSINMVIGAFRFLGDAIGTIALTTILHIQSAVSILQRACAALAPLNYLPAQYDALVAVIGAVPPATLQIRLQMSLQPHRVPSNAVSPTLSKYMAYLDTGRCHCRMSGKRADDGCQCGKEERGKEIR